MASTVLTLVLFFAGISMVVRWERLRRGLLIVAAGFLVASAIYIVTLPTNGFW